MEALIGLSDVYTAQLRYADTVTLLERALTVDVRNPSTLIRLSNHYRNYRHFDRSLTLRRQLISIREDDLDLHAGYHLVEYLRSGSWDSYDRWRSTISNDAAMRSTRILFADQQRAIARRDWEQALRLLDVSPDDLRNVRDSFDLADRLTVRALTLRAKGDRVAAENSARDALRLIAGELRKSSDYGEAWDRKALMHALLGERDAAHSAHAKAVAVAEQTSGRRMADFAYRRILFVHALLGDRKQALAELTRQLTLPDSEVHSARIQLELASLWDDPDFRAIINDPKSNAPLPIVNRDPPRLGK